MTHQQISGESENLKSEGNPNRKSPPNESPDLEIPVQKISNVFTTVYQKIHNAFRKFKKTRSYKTWAK